MPKAPSDGLGALQRPCARWAHVVPLVRAWAWAPVGRTQSPGEPQGGPRGVTQGTLPAPCGKHSSYPEACLIQMLSLGTSSQVCVRQLPVPMGPPQPRWGAVGMQGAQGLGQPWAYSHSSPSAPLCIKQR